MNVGSRFSGVGVLCLVAGCLGALPVNAEPGVSARRVAIGMSVPLTGPLAAQGQALRAGMQAAFDAVNANGGVQGRELQLRLRDDAGEAARALAQAQALLTEDDGVLALTGFVGAAALEAVLPPLLDGNVPLIGPATGAEPQAALARRPLFITRAGVREQVAAMLLHIDHLGITDIGLVAQSDALGQAGWDTLHAELVRMAMRPAAALQLPATGSNDALLSSVVQTLRKSGVQAVVLALEGPSALALIRALRKAGGSPAIYLLHDAWATLSAQGHVDELAGVAVAQALPNPNQESLRFVADYRRQIAKSGGSAGPASMEGYLNGRILIEGLTRCAREPSRRCLADALDSNRPMDLGGYRFQLNPETRRGSRWVEMGLVGRDGRLLR